MVSAVIPARNEQQWIRKTLISLREQSVPARIIVVDDGSTDETASISCSHADVVVNLPHHEESYAGKPELAMVINQGLRHVPSYCNYVLVLGADHSLPGNYVENVISLMVKEDVKVASGHIKDESYHPYMPRGSGRIYDFGFLKEIGFFPINWGWESYVLFKAMQMGHKVKCYKDVDAGKIRPTSIGKKKLYHYGKGMKALGYDFRYALGRAVINMSWSMFKGYLSTSVQVYEDIAEFVREFQRRAFWGRVKRILLQGGRK